MSIDDFNGDSFNPCRTYVRHRHEQRVDWGLIRFLSSNQVNANNAYLLSQLEDKEYDGWPHLTIDDWFSFFDYYRHVIEAGESAIDDGLTVVTAHPHVTLDLSAVLDDPNSCWNRYKYKLLNVKRFSAATVQSLETECMQVVRHLKADTHNGASVKGLVVGNVQSGKTANMAGVIAMAADLGFNFFVVLSGLITNLREQTEGRLYADLAMLDGERDQAMRLEWHVMHDLKTQCPIDQRLSSLQLLDTVAGSCNRNRYLNVCLKNKKRLRDLLGWLQAQDSAEKTGQLKVLVIDDECDQASVNTADISAGEKTRIFQLIKGLCDHSAPGARDSVRPGNAYKAINYIAYSATPFANVLSDGDSSSSLFPRDFICSLPMSPSYWGPSRYFSPQGDIGDDVFAVYPFINGISVAELRSIRGIHGHRSTQIPRSLAEAINWFVCAGAVRRQQRVYKPVSMLVHTSNKTNDHKSIADVIEQYMLELSRALARNAEEALASIEATYVQQRAAITPEILREMFPDYETSNGDLVNALPEFEEIKETIQQILMEQIAHIRTAEDATGVAYRYGRGVHLCVDNSCNNAVVEGDDGENYIMRIKYPEEGQSDVYAPLFLVVGGNTLSRGLTLEGLVCSYFVRTVRQGDSLMQMGRWFGYRFGYELLPRIWMSEDTLAKFSLLNQVDLDFRKSMREAMELGLPPTELVPCVIDTNDVIARFTITSPKKMQMAMTVSRDFAGQHKVISSYDYDESTLEHNEAAVMALLNEGNVFVHAPQYAPANYFCDSVEWRKVDAMLADYRPCVNGSRENDIALIRHYAAEHYGDVHWTVIVSGTSTAEGNAQWSFGRDREYSVGKVARAANCNDGYVSFQHVTQPADFVCDISHDLDCDREIAPFGSRGATSSVGYYRLHATRRGKNMVPLLIINRINGGNIVSRNGERLSRDILGVAFYFPGDAAGSVGSYSKLMVSNLDGITDDESEV